MRLVAYLAGAAILAALPGIASAERLFGLTGNTIITFDSATPGTITNSGAIVGIATGDTLLGLDLRPATKTLYSTGTSGNIYAIAKDASGTGYTASSVASTILPSGSRFGVDFNPVPDRLRVVSDTNQNLRINVGTGGATKDGDITLNGSPNVDLIGAAYTNSRSGTVTATTLYAIDALTSSLVRSTDPNNGLYTNLNTAGVAFGPLGFTIGASDAISFDISGGSGAAFLSNGNSLYSLSLASGAAVLIGTVGGGALAGLTAGSVPEPATWALMIGGFGAIGVAARRRRVALAA